MFSVVIISSVFSESLWAFMLAMSFRYLGGEPGQVHILYLPVGQFHDLVRMGHQTAGVLHQKLALGHHGPFCPGAGIPWSAP